MKPTLSEALREQVRAQWRRAALKAREMHRRKIGLEEAVAAYAEGDKYSLMFYTRHRDGIRARAEGDNVSEQACCAHQRVSYNPVRHANGTKSDRWLCDDCDHRFSPSGRTVELVEPKHADLLRERDEARAELSEIRSIVTDTLPDLEAKPDRETTVRRVAALATRYQYQRDAAALLRKDADRWEATSQAQAIEEHKLRAEVERLKREGSPGVLHAVDQAFLEVTVKERNAARSEAATLRAEVERLRAAPPVVNVTDIEAAVRFLTATNGSLNAMKLTPDGLRYTLRACTRPLDREGLAKSIYDARSTTPGFSYHTWGTLPEEVRPIWIGYADAVLRHLGAQAAQQDPVDAERASLAATKADAGKRLDAAKGSMRAGGYLAAQPVEQVIDLTTTLDEARRKLTHLSAADADHLRVILTRNLRPGFALAQPVEPKPPEPAWTQEQRNAAACVARVLHDEWTVFTTPHSDSGAAIERVCAALTTCAPLFAKVRVKLPRFAVMARHEIVTALREQGVEVDDELA